MINFVFFEREMKTLDLNPRRPICMLVDRFRAETAKNTLEPLGRRRTSTRAAHAALAAHRLLRACQELIFFSSSGL